MDFLSGHRGLRICLDVGPGTLVLVPVKVSVVFQTMAQKAYTATPITPTSQTCGCCSKTDSISTGDTWLPLTLIKSCGSSEPESFHSCQDGSMRARSYLFTVDNIPIAFIIDISYISCTDPAVGSHNLFRRGWVIPVSSS